MNGTRRCKIDNHISETASITTVFNTGTSALESDLPAVRLLFGDATADLIVRLAQAGVGVAVDDGAEVSEMGDIKVTDPSTVTSVFIGEGVTVGAYSQIGGDNTLSAADTLPTLLVDGGSLKIEGAFIITAATVNAGSVEANNAGAADVAFTTLTQIGGTVDFQNSGKTQVITTHNLDAGTRKRTDLLTVTTDNRSGHASETVLQG